jgi:putative endopeptidase
MRYTTLGLVSLALLAACSKQSQEAGPVAPPPPPKAAVGTFGVDLSAMDTSIKPGDDFYGYVNGKWLASFQIPPDRPVYGTGTVVSETVERDLHAIIDELVASKAASGTLEQKVAEIYSGWMDDARIEARGVAPIAPYLSRVASVANKADLTKLLGTIDYQAPFAVQIDADTVDPTRYTVWIGQSGLGMPNRDYYLNKGERYDAYRAAYATYVTKLFELVDYKDPARAAKQVIGIETRLAAVHWAPERQRKVSEVVNPMDLAKLRKLVPNVDWNVVFTGLGVGDTQNIIVGETTAIRDGAKLLDSEPLDAWKAYLTCHFIDSYASALPKAFDDAQFEFRSKSLRGIEKQRDRWKRGLAMINGTIGEGLGELYVRKHFTPDTKAKMDALVGTLRAALTERLKTLSWMDDATRAEALRKLDAFEPRIGYPDKWRDYSALTIEPGKLFENVHAARVFDWERQIKRIKDPVDRSEWGMTPQTVDAYYDSLKNQITFPAGILQPPFFDPNADPAVNYGAIGAVIGHEIGHGFDDQGREFDGSGKVRNWWTPETNAKFIDATQKLGALYHTYCPLEGLCVNGDLTMGENIGDLGGLEMAYTAYKLSLNGRQAPVLDGFTGDQRFFLSYAQAWRGKTRDDQLRAQILTDPHSPRAARGAVPPRNMDAWYAAFNVQPTDQQYLKPEERVRIW